MVAPDYAKKSCCFTGGAIAANELADVFQAVRVRWEIYVRVERREHVCAFAKNPIEFFLVVLCQAGPHALQGNEVVVAKMENPEIFKDADRVNELSEDCLLVCLSVGPKRMEYL